VGPADLVVKRRGRGAGWYGDAIGVSLAAVGALELDTRGVVVDGIYPAVAKVVEIGEKTANVKSGAIRRFKVRATGECPAAPIVAIFAKVGRLKITCLGAVRERSDVWDRLDVVDAAPVPVVGAAD